MNPVNEKPNVKLCALTRDIVRIERVQDTHVAVRKVKVKHIGVLFDPVPVRALGQDNVALLETPADQDLGWRFGVLCADLAQHGVLKFVSATERTVGLHRDVLGLAERYDFLTRQPWVDLLFKINNVDNE